MISLDVAIVVGTRNIRGVHINNVKPSGLNIKDVATNRSVGSLVIKNCTIVNLDLLQEVFTKGQLKVTPPIFVMVRVTRYSEHTSWLAFNARADER